MRISGRPAVAMRRPTYLRNGGKAMILAFKSSTGYLLTFSLIALFRHRCTSPAIAALQIARTREVKEHFIRQELHKIKEQREKGELRATGGIMRLGLIGGDQEGGGGSGSGDSGGGGSGEKTSSGGKAKSDSSGGDSE